jgi:membrane associated rhomboid family serine protease
MTEYNILEEKREVYLSAVYALILTFLAWVVLIVSVVFSLNFRQYGLRPLEPEGLIGIFTMPLLHSGWDHLVSNTPPLFVLFFGLFLFYKKTSWRILLYLYVISGFLTWLMGRSSTHIGASGLVYGLASFHFVSGVIKKVPRQQAFALLVAFLYGGFVWAFFPTLYRETNISWEGHLSGLITGIILAFYFRNDGLKPPVYTFMEEDEDDNEEGNYNVFEEKDEKLNTNI